MKHVLMFDFDGVIADSLDLFSDTFIAACRTHDFGQVRSRAAFLRLFDVNLYDGMAAAGIPRRAFTKVLGTMSAALPAPARRGRFFPGMPAALRRLAAAHRVVVITSNHSATVAAALRARKVTGIAAVLGWDVARSKVRKIRRVMRAHPGGAYYYIGDTRGDLIEGRAAGARTVAVTWGWHTEARLQKARPDYIVRSPTALVALFAGAGPARARKGKVP